ncbi:nucleoside diphosphate kinase regulator [Salinivirga cyanobacteriivorans]|uniref:Nucleoside diphosphate kinase regulator n=1 Tax=Salinivirga cyanobacteriivorans TaxID=1307839 RepID=A0A0S2I0Z7_9BACT|nr:hypothetical protein [Salinivirga cyanobacteriivorans]ALO15984.1 nucleoside diphosphate kinase regulator [Salinivirga cyanobacteriivorans]
MKNQTKNRVERAYWKQKSITSHDFNKLMNQISFDLQKSHVHPARLHSLYLLLAKSIKYEAQSIPHKTVSINSEFILSSESMHKDIIRIALPDDIQYKNDVSVYSPIGLACLGAREKDFISIDNTNQRLFIEKVFPAAF